MSRVVIGRFSGKSIRGTWLQFFLHNHTADPHDRLSDEEISERMHREYPGRNSDVFNRVSSARSQFNRNPDPGDQEHWGRALEENRCSHFISQRYDEHGNQISDFS